MPTMTVADNLFLGNERTERWGRVDFAAQEREAERLLGEAGLDVAPRRLVAELPVSTQQMIEIARALARDAALFILDEPTSALNEPEVEALFARIATLRREGRGIVYITHKMEEIYRLADRITVLRDGSHVVTAPAAELPPAELVARLVGRELDTGSPGRPPPAAPRSWRCATSPWRTPSCPISGWWTACPSRCTRGRSSDWRGCRARAPARSWRPSSAPPGGRCREA